jgi:hypothetical protein
MISKQIGWSQESNLLYQILKQLNKLTSIIFGLKEAATPKYKVYTALVTQSGGDNIREITGGNLNIGETYVIYESAPTAEGYDFTNVGAPNNNIGTFFVATGTTPNSWGNNNVGLRCNTGAPVVTVLENTIGNIWFTYNSVGIYFVNSNSLFIENKTYLPQANIDISLVASSERFLLSGWNNENILTLNNTDASFTSTDDIGRGYLEIRVYN